VAEVLLKVASETPVQVLVATHDERVAKLMTQVRVGTGSVISG